MKNPTLHTWGTPNGLKPVLLFEELGVPYELSKIHIGQGGQKTAAFHSKNLNERIPVLETEHDGVPFAISESAAILVHVAEANGQRFFAAAGPERAHILQWLFFQMSAVGPMFGQLGYWRRREPKNTEAIERYDAETRRVYGVLEERLGQARYLASDEYSIADMATVFWARSVGYFGLSLDSWPNVARWVGDLEARPAMARTLAITWP